MDKPRIALFIPSLIGGGAERVMVTLANGFADEGYKVDLVLVSAEGPYLAEVAKAVRVVELGGRRVTRALPRLAGYLRREKPRALLSAMYHANAIAILAGKMSFTGVPVVAIEQSSPRRLLANWRTRMVLRAVRLLYPRASRVVACSHGVRRELSQIAGVPVEQIDVIYNPIPIDQVRQRSREHVDHPWLEDRSFPVVLAVGRLIPEKDFSTLISAFAKVRHPKARLVILGDGPHRAVLEGQVRSLQLATRVAMPGFSRNPYAWMSKAAVFVLSSATEGLPTVLMEALACGARVISTDCESGPSEILEGGRHGTLVPVGNVDLMARAIEDVLAKEAHQIAPDSTFRFSVAASCEAYKRLLP